MILGSVLGLVIPVVHMKGAGVGRTGTVQWRLKMKARPENADKDRRDDDGDDERAEPGVDMA